MLSSDSALAAVLDVESPDRRAHIRSLIDSTEEGLDDKILALLEDHSAVRAELCRILAERDRDRDPSYVLAYFAQQPKPGRKPGRIDAWMRSQAYRSPLGIVHGIPRLRRASAIEHYRRDVTSWRTTRRFSAVLSLGDTADPAALPLVVKALRDRKWYIRAEAAVALRRLIRDGAVAPEAVESVADALVACLSHRRPKVVEHAAAALSAPLLRDRLVEARRSSRLKPASAALVDAALEGKVPALPPIWVGDVEGE
ncbi:HEAT repeat protein [Saccharothrix ecbatanensis]|uniref:HEAT repeat protein n=1 Tax=Saccharothrix ecbatanensis TaxID=1105145 RepID=A0A7W9M2K5_9PSEU|nr:HEAT repeat domain-containing protein [Saccharothrix ecbatanensis]MBB5805075.1 HEAT repeat protein [Saccharothrix ecbatanensis]